MATRQLPAAMAIVLSWPVCPVLTWHSSAFVTAQSEVKLKRVPVCVRFYALIPLITNPSSRGGSL